MSDAPPHFDLESLAELPAELALGQLPPGRHGLPRSFVARNQRLRIVAAMLRALAEHGYAGTTISHLTHEAGVSRTAFYTQFSSKEDCFLATYDIAGEWLVERIEEALVGDGGMPERTMAAVAKALRLLAANPPLARLFAIDAIQAGRASRERQRACLARISAVLGAERGDRSQLPPELDEMLLGGALATIARYVDSGRVEQLPEASEEMVRYLLTPYAGPEATDEVLEESA